MSELSKTLYAQMKESEELDWGFTSVATNLQSKIIRKNLEGLGYGE